jgi:hypothetical protein
MANLRESGTNGAIIPKRNDSFSYYYFLLFKIIIEFMGFICEIYEHSQQLLYNPFPSLHIEKMSKKSQNTTHSRYPFGSLSIVNTAILPNVQGTKRAFLFIILIQNIFLSSLISQSVFCLLGIVLKSCEKCEGRYKLIFVKK